jgi:protein-disulfide isomerase
LLARDSLWPKPSVSHVFNVAEYLSLGVTRTPAVLVDGEIVLAGKVPTVPELMEILAARRS